MKKFKILLNFIKDVSVETPDAETLIFVRDNIAKYVLNMCSKYVLNLCSKDIIYALEHTLNCALNYH